jgi:hypothetical protein
MVEEAKILREGATTPRYMHNAFLIIFGVAISGEIFFLRQRQRPIKL